MTACTSSREPHVVGQGDAAPARSPRPPTPESGASLSRAQSTTTMPFAWKNAVSWMSIDRPPAERRVEGPGAGAVRHAERDEADALLHPPFSTASGAAMRTGPAGAGPPAAMRRRWRRWPGPRRRRAALCTIGVAAVAALAQRGLQRHLAQQRHAELAGQRGAAARAEELVALAAARAHAGSSCSRSRRASRLAEPRDHRAGALGDALGGRLGRRDEHGLGAREQLRRARCRRRRCRAACRSAGSRAAPQWTSERNCSSARCSIGPRHMTAPLSSRKKPIEITFTSWATGGTIILSTVDRAAAGCRACPDREAVDVGVDDAHLVAPGAQGQRQVDRQRRLAHAALAGRDRR